jgi:hypothetical protein
MGNKREKFIELANRRVNRAVRDIRLIANLSNRSAYESTPSDVKLIVRTLQKELETLKQRFVGQGEEETRAFWLER